MHAHIRRDGRPPCGATSPAPAARGRGLLRRILSPFAAVLLLAACAFPPVPGGSAPVLDDRYPGVTSVRVNGQNLPPAQALEELSRLEAGWTAQIPPEAKPLAGTARIVIPDHDRLRPVMVQQTHLGQPGQLEFATEQLHRNLRDNATLIAHSNIFTSVTIAEQNDTVAPDAAGADYLIWFQVRSIAPNNAGPWASHWLVKRGGSTAVQPFGFDIGTPPGVPRLQSLLRSLKFAVGTLSGQTAVAGANAPQHPASSGSGIIVDASGHILTNNHVVAGCPRLHVIDAAHGAATASLVAADATNDLALLRADRSWPSWARFADDRGLRPGEPVVATGFPLSGLVSAEMAVTTGSLTALAGFRGDTRQLEFSAPIQPGNSGGPVLDQNGRVIGVTVAMLNGLMLAAATGAMPQNVNFAIKTQTVRGFLDANRIAVETGASHPGLTSPEVADLARGFTVKVECWR